MEWAPKMEENGIRIEDWDQDIYRIFSEKRLLNMLVAKENGLVRPSAWEDPFENFFLKHGGVMPDGTPIDFSNLADGWYGQCWTTQRESDAMWRIYSHGKDGVRVRTTARKLLSSIWKDEPFASLKYFIGGVQYKTRQFIEGLVRDMSLADVALGGQSASFAETLLIKRPEFEHEHEVRLLFHDAEHQFSTRSVWTHPFDVNSLVTEITLDPRLDDREAAEAAARIEALGCTVPIVASDLYKIFPTRVRMR
jgi:hypothetical protein